MGSDEHEHDPLMRLDDDFDHATVHHPYGTKKGRYSSDYSERMMEASKEKPITSYTPSPAELFAEMFRLFVTNHLLLRKLRPVTWELLMADFKPVGTSEHWVDGLLGNPPEHIIDNLCRKGVNK